MSFLSDNFWIGFAGGALIVAIIAYVARVMTAKK
jgi:hypothetical protein